MDAREVTLEMLKDSGLSARQAAIAIGKEPGYLSHIIYKGSKPNTVTLAKVADVCGFDLLVRNRANEMEMLIDPYDD